MADFGKTWWGKQWLNALAHIDYSNRLPRGRSYARNDYVKTINIKDNTVKAKVKGSRRTPYSIEINGEKKLFRLFICPSMSPAGTAVRSAASIAVTTLKVLTRKCRPSSPVINFKNNGSTETGEGSIALLISRERASQRIRNIRNPIVISFKE